MDDTRQPAAWRQSQFLLRFRGLLDATAWLTIFASVIGCFGRWHWFADLFSHYRVQYGLGLLFAFVVLRWLGDKRRVLLVLLLGVLNLLFVAPLWFGPVYRIQPGDAPLRVLLANINASLAQPQKILPLVGQHAPDVIILQEVTPMFARAFNAAVSNDYPHTIQETRVDNFGIAVWSRHPLENSEVLHGEALVPSIATELNSPRGRVCILATHPLPPSRPLNAALRNRQFEEIAQWTKTAPRPLLVAGDLNTTPWNFFFKKLLRDTGLKNASQGRGVFPTWPTFLPLLYIPLDHVLYSDGIDITGRQTGARNGSDHLPVIVDFVIHESTPGSLPCGPTQIPNTQRIKDTP